MALINCPECGTEVSDQAQQCPKCAYPLNSKSEPSKPAKEVTTNVTVKPKEGCFLQTMNVGCMIVFALIAIIILIAIFGSA